MASYGGGNQSVDDCDRVQIQNKIHETEGKMLESVKNSLQLVIESEQMGIETGKELISQGERLNKTEEKLDQINKDMKTTTKRIAFMKSSLGGYINIIRTRLKPKEKVSKWQSSELLRKVTEGTEAGERQNDEHPALKLRNPSLSQSHDYSTDNIDQQIYENLDELSSGVTGLKHLALGIAEELDIQNKQLDRIQEKASKADGSTFNAAKNVNKLLYK